MSGPAGAADDVLARFRAFAANELIGKEAYFDDLPAPPTVASLRLEEEGLANWWLPVRHGGLGATLHDSVDIVSELAYADAGFAFGAFLPVLPTVMLQLYGGADLMPAVLARLSEAGGTIAVMGSEEPAGSELARTATTFRADGDRLILDGEKFFSTNLETARTVLVLARATGDDYAMIAVDRDAPGLRVTKRWDMVGVRGSATYGAELRDCTVPATDRLQGNGLRILEVGLNASRILIAASAVGISRRIRDLAMRYGATKRLKGGLLADNAVFAAKLGQMEATIDVMRNQCRAAAAEFDVCMGSADAGRTLYRSGTLRSAVTAKMFCGQAGWQLASAGSEIFGGLGYSRDHLIGKLVRDMRYVSVVEGGDDVLRDLMYNRYVAPARKRI